MNLPYTFDTIQLVEDVDSVAARRQCSVYDPSDSPYPYPDSDFDLGCDDTLLCPQLLVTPLGLKGDVAVEADPRNPNYVGMSVTSSKIVGSDGVFTIVLNGRCWTDDPFGAMLSGAAVVSSSVWLLSMLTLGVFAAMFPMNAWLPLQRWWGLCSDARRGRATFTRALSVATLLVLVLFLGGNPRWPRSN